MNVTDALRTRISVRAFLDDPVETDLIRDILSLACRSPSGGNLQPWKVYVVNGARLSQLKDIIAAKMKDAPRGEGTEYDIYPPALGEPYLSRRFRNGEQLYKTLGIPREDKSLRREQFARNFRFFDAPAALFFSIDRQMGIGQWVDLGMFMQSIMLLAVERGLGACAQEAWATWHKTVGEFIGIPENEMLFAGMALGYPDPEAPVNTLRTERADLSEIATFL